MTDVHLVLGYPNAELQWKIWSEEEETIDFRKDSFAANRCSSAFAASELKYFLGKADPDLSLQIREQRPSQGLFIELKISEEESGGGFLLRPDGEGLMMIGHGRNGLINGAYEVIRRQGWRWLEPGQYGESAPEKPHLNWPKEEIVFRPSFRYRGMDAFRTSNDSENHLKWLSRNRCNVCFRKAATGKLADKLGMFSRQGGHLLQTMLQPNNLLPNGKSLWETHPEWYGLPSDGKRRKETAIHCQLCLAQESLFDYLGEKILHILDAEFADVDILDLWSFDTWGATCSCPFCVELGNGVDQTLYLLSQIRRRLDNNLRRQIWLNGILYEGTASMAPPTRKIPENLQAAKDILINYPIKRCYRHSISDFDCTMNRLYEETISAWSQCHGGLSIWIGEYYNVSRFEDLPLLFHSLIPSEMRHYHSSGMDGATFMHDFPVAWGVRALSKLQHAQYAWDVQTDDNRFFDEYFTRKYGNYSRAMSSIYDRIETAFNYISSLRNYGAETLTSVLNRWDGKKPEKPLSIAHFPDQLELLQTLKEATKILDQVLCELQKIINLEQQESWKKLPADNDWQNGLLSPLELESRRNYDKTEYRLGEDLRGLIYGRDSMWLMLALCSYHMELQRGGKGNQEWELVEQVATRLASSYVPLSFENPTGIICKDGLTRTQLRKVLTRCRGVRCVAQVEDSSS